VLKEELKGNKLFYIYSSMGSEPEQCLICLEKFTENEAYIPELECECAIFVHWACWDPWAGGCLYCRDEYIEYDDEPIVIPERHNAIVNFIYHDDLTKLLINISLVSFILYFYIAINYSIWRGRLSEDGYPSPSTETFLSRLDPYHLCRKGLKQEEESKIDGIVSSKDVQW
jgi:hypothetical protein